MDLSNYDLCALAEKGFECNLLDPSTGKPTDIVFNIIGSDSRVYREAKSKSYRSAALGVSVDEISAEVYSSCVKDWSGLAMGDDEIEFSPEKCIEIFTKFPWIMDQVGLAVEKRANFMKAPVKS